MHFLQHADSADLPYRLPVYAFFSQSIELYITRRKATVLQSLDISIRHNTLYYANLPCPSTCTCVCFLKVNISKTIELYITRRKSGKHAFTYRNDSMHIGVLYINLFVSVGYVLIWQAGCVS